MVRLLFKIFLYRLLTLCILIYLYMYARCRKNVYFSVLALPVTQTTKIFKYILLFDSDGIRKRLHDKCLNPDSKFAFLWGKNWGVYYAKAHTSIIRAALSIYATSCSHNLLKSEWRTIRNMHWKELSVVFVNVMSLTKISECYLGLKVLNSQKLKYEDQSYIFWDFQKNSHTGKKELVGLFVNS